MAALHTVSMHAATSSSLEVPHSGGTSAIPWKTYNTVYFYTNMHLEVIKIGKDHKIVNLLLYVKALVVVGKLSHYSFY